MTGQNGSEETTTLAILERADAVCDRFEAEWARGERPRIEDRLDGAADSAREHLLRELVLVEIECRRNCGETPNEEEYSSRFPDLPAAWIAQAVATESTACALDRASRFRLLSRVGSGSFGVVWRAQDSLLGRVVALKVPHPAVAASPEALERFRREARAASGLRHPNIVTVHGAVEFNGTAALVADYVQGESLADLLRRRRLAPREAASLAAALAEALDYAHAMGAVHRDVKPANVLIAPGPPSCGSSGDSALAEVGRPWLVDFGLARGDHPADATLTADGQLLGTPAYMSPEQAAGRGHRADRRSDVYSLGVVLYEMLTGRPPFQGPGQFLLEQIRSAEPQRPRAIDRHVPRALETVCLKAMAKEPSARYQSAGALADDLRRWLRGEPIRASAPRPWERAYRWARRRPALSALLMVSGVAAVAVAVAAVTMRYNAQLEQARKVAETNLYFHRLALASREWTAGNVWRVEQLLDECPPGLRGWEWHYLRKQCHGFGASIFHDSAEEGPASFPVVAVAYSPDGRILASAGGKSEAIKLWDTASRDLLRRFSGPQHGASALVFRPDGQALVVGGLDGSVHLWNVTTGRKLRSWALPESAVYSVAVSADGRRIAAGVGGRYWKFDEPARSVVYVWDAATGNEVCQLVGHRQRVTAVAFRPGGHEIVSADGSTFFTSPRPAGPGAIRLWDAETGQFIREFTGHASPVAGLAWDAAGRRLAAAGWDGVARVLDADSGKELLRLARHYDWIRGIAFSPDQGLLATAGADGALRLWDGESGRPVQTLRGHTAAVAALAFCPDGREIATASLDGTIKFWDPTARPESVTVRPFSHEVAALTFTADGNELHAVGTAAVADGDYAVALKSLDPHSGVERQARSLVAGFRDRAALSPNGLVVACVEGLNIHVFDAPSGRKLWAQPVPDAQIRQVMFSPDSRIVYAVGAERQEPVEPPPRELLRAWAADSGSELSRVLGSQRCKHTRAAVRPDGRLLAVGADAYLTLWDLHTMTALVTFPAHDRALEALAFSADGSRLATASRDLTAKVWDVTALLAGKTAPSLVLQGHMRKLSGVAWSPDARRLVTCAEDRTIRVWDAATGQEALLLRTEAELPARVAWSPAGGAIAAGDRAGTIHIWEAKP